MKNMSLFLSFIIVLICLLFSTVSVSANSSELKDKSEEELRQFAKENNTWVVCYRQGKRTTSFFQYDATSEYMYFSYSKECCVDVYDLHGNFLYSFIFPDRQNGGVCVRCEEDQVYISTKDNLLYIFKGIEEVDHMDYDEAAANGYDFFWFYENSPCLRVDSNLISMLDDDGNTISQIKTPTVIAQSIPASMSAHILRMLIIVLFVLVSRLSVYLAKKRGL